MQLIILLIGFLKYQIALIQNIGMVKMLWVSFSMSSTDIRKNQKAVRFLLPTILHLLCIG